MIDGKMHRIMFDHFPSKREVDEVLSKIYAEKPSSAAQGTFKSCALQYIAIKENVLSPSTVRSYDAMVRSMSEDFLNIPMKDLSSAEDPVFDSTAICFFTTFSIGHAR